MNLKLDCPHAKYGRGMVIYCQADGEPCGHQYFKPCKGWSALSPGAERCTLRKELRENGDERNQSSGD